MFFNVFVFDFHQMNIMPFAGTVGSGRTNPSIVGSKVHDISNIQANFQNTPLSINSSPTVYHKISNLCKIKSIQNKVPAV